MKLWREGQKQAPTKRMMQKEKPLVIIVDIRGYAGLMPEYKAISTGCWIN